MAAETPVRATHPHAEQQQLDSRALEVAIEARTMAQAARDACRSEYEALRSETRLMIDRQDTDRSRMHSENAVRFSSQDTKLDRLHRALYIAGGVVATVTAMASPIGNALLKMMHS